MIDSAKSTDHNVHLETLSNCMSYQTFLSGDNLELFLSDPLRFGSYISKNRSFLAWLNFNKLTFTFNSFILYFEEAKNRGLLPRSLQVIKSQIRRIFEVLIDEFPEEWNNFKRYELELRLKRIKTGSVHSKIITKDYIMNEDELNHMITTARSERLKLLFRFFSETGVRVGELVDIQLVNCKKSRTVIHIIIIGKGKKQREIEIRKELFNKIIKTYKPVNILFCKKDRNAYTTRQISRQVASEGLRILNRKISPHMFRHSFATIMLGTGLDNKAVSMWLGHVDIATTHEMYNHPEPLNVTDIPIFGGGE